MPLNPNIHRVMVIGSGPIVIGQAAEFDYAGTQACRALIEKNYGRRLREGGRDKVIAALARRGFSYGAIRAALEQCGETADEDGSWE